MKLQLEIKQFLNKYLITKPSFFNRKTKSKIKTKRFKKPVQLSLFKTVAYITKKSLRVMVDFYLSDIPNSSRPIIEKYFIANAKNFVARCRRSGNWRPDRSLNRYARFVIVTKLEPAVPVTDSQCAVSDLFA